MSVDPWAFRRWAFEQVTGNVGRKAVLAALASMADSATGRCEAKHESLAQWVEVSRRSVIRHVEALRDAGLVATRRQYRRDGSRRGDEFLLLAPWVTEWPDGEPVQSDSVAPIQSANGDRSKVPTATREVLQLSQQEEPLEERPLRNEIPTGSPAELDVVWGHYQAARKAAIPRSNGCKLGDVERRTIRNALKVRDVEDCKAAIDGLFRSDYHLQGGFIGIKYALLGGGRSPDPGTTIDRLANGRGSGRRLRDRTYRGLAWDELTPAGQVSVREASSMGLEVWDGGHDAWADRDAERDRVAVGALRDAAGAGEQSGWTAETFGE